MAKGKCKKFAWKIKLHYGIMVKRNQSRVERAKFKVHLTPIFFSAEMKLSNIHKRNLPIFLVSDIFKGFKN